MSSPTARKLKRKRRGKDSQDGRDFKCQYCPKAYLSHPALYSHIKNKHPDKELSSAPTGEGKRKRKSKKKSARIPPPPESEDFFKNPELAGGPIDPIYGFEESLIYVFTQLSKDTDIEFSTYPLYKSLQKLSFDKTPGNPEEDKQESGKEEGEKKQPAKDPGLSTYEALKDEKHNYLNCDDIFAVYLRHVSQKVNESSYKVILIYIICYRECVNQIGPTFEEPEPEPEGIASGAEDTINTSNNGDALNNGEIDYSQIEFCSVNNAQMIPQFTNYFLTDFLINHQISIENEVAINLTRNFCRWLYDQDLTEFTLRMCTP
ncbi:unnamed protein product [Moneuplotes crassus]|uniref:C2H2-type domain-containing protein n=1 Tax=Euplotes crassus TaxID=5936 RepID=A0AAD2D181_EUPCR|nr:unnamed protein product [Moneuplotes crassus]